MLQLRVHSAHWLTRLQRHWHAHLRNLRAFADVPVATALGVGMLSDVITMIFDVPIDTMVLRSAATGESLIEAIRAMYEEYGLWGFW